MLQTGQSRKPQGLCTGYRFCLECLFPQILPSSPSLHGVGSDTSLSDSLSQSLLVPLLSNCLSTPTASPLVPGSLVLSGSPFLKR